MRYFKQMGEFASIKESTVRGRVNAYKSKLAVESKIIELQAKQ